MNKISLFGDYVIQNIFFSISNNKNNNFHDWKIHKKLENIFFSTILINICGIPDFQNIFTPIIRLNVIPATGLVAFWTSFCSLNKSKKVLLSYNLSVCETDPVLVLFGRYSSTAAAISPRIIVTHTRNIKHCLILKKEAFSS